MCVCDVYVCDRKLLFIEQEASTAGLTLPGNRKSWSRLGEKGEEEGEGEGEGEGEEEGEGEKEGEEEEEGGGREVVVHTL